MKSIGSALLLAEKDPEFRSFLDMMEFDSDDPTLNDFSKYISGFPYSPGMFTCDEFLKAWNRYV
jgi:hypothetical protein